MTDEPESTPEERKLALKSFANYLAQHRRRKPAPVPDDYIAAFIEGLKAGKAMRGIPYRNTE